MEELNRRISESEKKIKEYFKTSQDTMLEKNKQRGDCWRGNGLVGQFTEIHTIYFRLRHLIWLRSPDGLTFKSTKELMEWEAQVQNALEDMRNFTILAELCLHEGNLKGEKLDERL